jgi:hypothetical protein
MEIPLNSDCNPSADNVQVFRDSAGFRGGLQKLVGGVVGCVEWIKEAPGGELTRTWDGPTYFSVPRTVELDRENRDILRWLFEENSP